jgi:hypothetical protein
VSYGGSLHLWEKYFGEKVNVFGFDINPQCKQLEETNVRIFIGSKSDPMFLTEVAQFSPDMDIILEDGEHTMLQQILTFEKLFLKLKEGGVFIW